MDQAKEWQRLTTLYRGKTGEELQELAEDFGDLTEIAQQVLRDELKSRGLRSPEEVVQTQSAPALNLNDSPQDEVPWILRESGDSRTLGEMQSALEQSGIRSKVVAPHENIYRTQLLQLQVDEQNASRAEEVLAAPRAMTASRSEEEDAEDFEAPMCSQCGSSDPLLESIEPSNTWLCENCGHRWMDPAA